MDEGPNRAFLLTFAPSSRIATVPPSFIISLPLRECPNGVMGAGNAARIKFTGLAKLALNALKLLQSALIAGLDSA